MKIRRVGAKTFHAILRTHLKFMMLTNGNFSRRFPKDVAVNAK